MMRSRTARKILDAIVLVSVTIIILGSIAFRILTYVKGPYTSTGF
ncbi:MAG: hypothetical protein R6V03_04825 [Kiritimatiellia bacterium]